MFTRRNAAILLVDAQMALRSGSWIVDDARNPAVAIGSLERTLASPASDEIVADVMDKLYTVMGEAQMAGELMTQGYEQYQLGDILPELIITVPAIAANDVAPLPKAA